MTYTYIQSLLGTIPLVADSVQKFIFSPQNAILFLQYSTSTLRFFTEDHPQGLTDEG